MRFRSRRDGRSLHLTFDDGGMNVLSAAALRELLAIFEGLDSGVRIVALRSGRPIFAAGADMREMAAFDSGDAADFSELGQALMQGIERCPAMTIAAIEGDCFGGALDLAMAFDWRIATPTARFSHPGGRLGIVTGFGGTSRWAKIVAPAAARKMFLANAVLTAGEAEAAGVVDELASSIEEGLAACEKRWSAIEPGRARALRELLYHGRRPGESRLLAQRLAGVYQARGDDGTD